MLAYLQDEGIPEAHAEKIAAHVYESPNLSRITYRDFRQAVENSPFRQIAWIDKRTAFRPDEDTARKLASLDSAEGQDHSVQGVAFVLARP